MYSVIKYSMLRMCGFQKKVEWFIVKLFLKNQVRQPQEKKRHLERIYTWGIGPKALGFAVIKVFGFVPALEKHLKHTPAAERWFSV